MFRVYGEATCTDCGRDYVNRPDETGALCDECGDQRDAHSSAAQLRMAKARLTADDQIREVA